MQTHLHATLDSDGGHLSSLLMRESGPRRVASRFGGIRIYSDAGRVMAPRTVSYAVPRGFDSRPRYHQPSNMDTQWTTAA